MYGWMDGCLYLCIVECMCVVMYRFIDFICIQMKIEFDRCQEEEKGEMCVFLFVCMYVCMCVCLYVSMVVYTCMHVCLHVSNS